MDECDVRDAGLAPEQQGRQMHLDRGPLHPGHLVFIRPFRVSQAQPVGADGDRRSQVHIEVATDVEAAARARFNRALNGALEPVPVPNQEQDQHRE